MSDPNEPAVPTEKSQESSTASKVLNGIAYPAAIGVGYWNANITAHNSAYRQAKGLGMFDDILATSTPETKKDVKEAVDHVIDKVEFKKRWTKTKAAYQEAGFKRMDELGLDSFKEKWNYMAREGKQMTVRNGLAGFGIALGALLSIANSKTLDKVLSGKSDTQQR